MSELAKAIVSVMLEVKGVEKNLSVGGQYKGVASKDIYITVGRAMSKNGLSIIPTKITPKNTVEFVNGKAKVFLEVLTEYTLLHTSGASMTLTGYGHAMDSGDKAAGKATTYALKYALLYTFLVPTGDIDDTDATHSKDLSHDAPHKVQSATYPKTDLAELMKKRYQMDDAGLKAFSGSRGGVTKEDAEMFLGNMTALDAAVEYYRSIPK